MSWSSFYARRDTTAGAATIQFKDLGAAPELMLVVSGLQIASGTPDVMVQVSADNGSTWDTTNYQHYGDTGTTGFVLATAVPVATDVGGSIELFFWNVAQRTWARISGGRGASATAPRRANGENTQATAWNALQILNSTGVNFSFSAGGYAELRMKTA